MSTNKSETKLKQSTAHNLEEGEILDAIKKMPPEERDRVVMMSRERFRGPIPSPKILKEFESVHPGLADRIVKMAEEQSSHRQYIEKKVVHSNSNDSRLGLIFGFIISLVGIVGGLALIFVDKGAQGLTLICGVIVALVTVFIYGTNSEKKERIEKNQELKKNQKSNKSESDN